MWHSHQSWVLIVGISWSEKVVVSLFYFFVSFFRCQKHVIKYKKGVYASEPLKIQHNK